MQIAKSGLLCQICVQRLKKIGCFLLEPPTQDISRSIQQIVRRATKQTGVHDICSTPQRVAFYKSNQYLIKTQGHRLTRQWIFSPLACLLKTIRLISEKPSRVIGGKVHVGFMHLFSRWLFSKSLAFSFFPQRGRVQKDV